MLEVFRVQSAKVSDIQLNPIHAFKKNTGKCCEYVERLRTQQQPENMSYEEWCRIRITEAKVLAYLKQTVSRQQQPKYEDKIVRIKRGDTLVFKAYSPKMARQLTPGMETAGADLGYRS